eukprot:Clim_evm20s143 gene=Clim_evmTU20s143
MSSGTLQLIQHRSAWGAMSWDPLCLAVQTFLRFNGLKFYVNSCGNNLISPKDILPLLRDSGQQIAGFEDIVDHIYNTGRNKYGFDGSERRRATLIIAMVKDALRIPLLDALWGDRKDFETCVLPLYEKMHPWPLSRLLAERDRADTLTLMYEGRKHLDRDAIVRKLENVLSLLSDMLQGKKFVLGGSAPSEADAIIFAYLFLLKSCPSTQLLWRRRLEKHSTLEGYCERIRMDYF